MLIVLQTNEGGVIDDDALFGDEVEGEDNPFVIGGFADMFGEDFLGLRELGIASELGVSNLSVPKKLLRPKGARMGPGSSLPYVETLLMPYLLAYSFMVPLFGKQKQTNGTTASFSAATPLRSARINEDGRRSHWSLATLLQVSLRCSCTISSHCVQILAPHRG